MTIFSLKDLVNLSTDSCSASMAPVRACLDHIEAIKVIESRIPDQGISTVFPISGSTLYLCDIQILETTNRDYDRALRAEYSAFLKLTVISFLRKVIQDNVFWSLSRTRVRGLHISKSNREDGYLCLRKYGLDECHFIRLR